MAGGAPASAATEKRRVVPATDHHGAGAGLLLEMALEAERGVTRRQEFGVHGPVWIMA